MKSGGYRVGTEAAKDRSSFYVIELFWCQDNWPILHHITQISTVEIYGLDEIKVTISVSQKKKKGKKKKKPEGIHSNLTMGGGSGGWVGEGGDRKARGEI